MLANIPLGKDVVGEEELVEALRSVRARTGAETEQQELNIAKIQLFIKEFEEVSTAIRDLLRKTHHPVMVPLGPVAFVPGNVIHTNEYSVHLGDSYFAEMSAQQTLSFIARRQAFLREQLGRGKAGLGVYQGNLNVAESEEMGVIQRTDEEGNQVLEIREPVEEEQQPSPGPGPGPISDTAAASASASASPSVPRPAPSQAAGPSAPSGAPFTEEELRAARERNKSKVQQAFDHVLAGLQQAEEGSDSDDEGGPGPGGSKKKGPAPAAAQSPSPVPRLNPSDGGFGLPGGAARRGAEGLDVSDTASDAGSEDLPTSSPSSSLDTPPGNFGDGAGPHHRDFRSSSQDSDRGPPGPSSRPPLKKRVSWADRQEDGPYSAIQAEASLAGTSPSGSEGGSGRASPFSSGGAAVASGSRDAAGPRRGGLKKGFFGAPQPSPGGGGGAKAGRAERREQGATTGGPGSTPGPKATIRRVDIGQVVERPSAPSDPLPSAAGAADPVAAHDAYREKNARAQAGAPLVPDALSPLDGYIMPGAPLPAEARSPAPVQGEKKMSRFKARLLGLED